MTNQHPPHEMWLHIIIAGTISVNVVIGVISMAYMAMMEIAIPDQFDRIITLMVGALIGFLTKAGVDHMVEVSNTAANPVKAELVEEDV